MVSNRTQSRYARFQARNRRRLDAAKLAGQLSQRIRARQLKAQRPPLPVKNRKENEHLTRLHIGEALLLDAFRTSLRDKVESLRSMLDVLHSFDTSQHDIQIVINRLSRLLHEKPYLVEAFNILLPDGHLLDNTLIPNVNTGSLRSSPAPEITIESIESERVQDNHTVSLDLRAIFVDNASSPSSDLSDADSWEKKSSSRRASDSSSDYGHFYIRRALSWDSNDFLLSASPISYLEDALMQSPVSLSETGSIGRNLDSVDSTETHASSPASDHIIPDCEALTAKA
ncbi:hypothetical protein CPC08DRAFT_168421 [Agrocybe pediades]|nr:hypothetical protein CPC08DRAFT_168421 [Agrocybe pediades]